MLMDPAQCVKSARLIVEKENMKQLSDISSLMEICQELVEEHQEAVCRGLFYKQNIFFNDLQCLR